MLDVEYQSQPVDENKVLDVFQTILASDLSIEFKVKISQRRMEFLEDFGTCIKRFVLLVTMSAWGLYADLLSRSVLLSKGACTPFVCVFV